MTNAQDVADLILDPYAIGGLTSDSEVEDDAVVEVQHEEFLKRQSQQNENQPQQQESITTSKKRAIKLVELGPRINMSLLKIEEGLVGSSKTLYHSSVSKSVDEAQKLDAKHKLKEKLKQERRAKQQAAVQAKLDKSKQRNLEKKQDLKVRMAKTRVVVKLVMTRMPMKMKTCPKLMLKITRMIVTCTVI